MKGKDELKYSIESKNYTLILIGGIFIAIGLLLGLTTWVSENIILNFFDILCPSFGFAVGIIAAVREENIKNKFYRNIGIGFLFLGALNIITLIIKLGYIERLDFAYVNSIRMDMAIFIIIIAWIVEKLNGSSYLSILVYMGSIAVLTVVHMWDKNISGLSISTSLLLIVLSVYLVNNRRKDEERENKYLYLYLIFIIISQILFFFDCKYNLKIGLYYDAIRYFAYFVIYQGCVKYLVEFVYISALEDLEAVKRDKSKLNKEIRTRNKILNDMNINLSKSELITNEMLSKFGDGIILFYMERVVYINDAALKLFNIKHREQILGSPFRRVIYLIAENLTEINSKEYYEFVDKDYFRINNRNISIFREIKNKDKEYEITVLKTDVLNQIVYINDITEVAQGIKAHKKYEDIVKEREIKERFYSNISHELRTPVNVIFSALQLKDIYIRDEAYNLIEKNDKIIKQNCLRLSRTISNFIDTNKISEGKMRAEFGVYNIVAVVENIAQASTRYFDKVNTRLIFDAEEEEIYVKIDKLMIERVVLNILSNSLKYGKNNGLIDFNIVLDNRKVKIIIKNNGYTIPLEAREYIFEKFTKTDNTFSRESEGSGLGLYLVRELVYLNNGNLELSTDYKDGNKFIITLPIVDNIEEEILYEESEINTLEEKVDIEFSDVYI